MSDQQLCCFQSRDQFVTVCNECHPLTIFGWLVPAWLELAAAIGFGALVVGLIVYIAGLSMCWWGPK
jgi:hypothetical protein